jgi:peptidyl-prolyl cis-trans isomerase C
VCLYAQQKPPEEGTTVPLKFPTATAPEPVPPDTVVLQVGETKITAGQLDALIDVYPVNQQIFARGPGKQQFADTLVRMLVLADEARKRKLDETEKFKEQLRFSESNLLAQTLSAALPNEIPTDDAALHKYFDEHRCEFSTWKARHIVLRFKGSPLAIRPGEGDLSEEEALAKARDIRARLVKGADFAMLAREQSDDPTTAESGGELGQVRHGQVMPSFEDALCRMNPGEISEPVKLPTGYHVIQMLSVETKDFADVKAGLGERYRNDAVKKLVEELIAKVKVVKNPAYYAPPAPPSDGTKKP